ncbi:MAG TPA: hypothetical protein PLY70_20245, partial [Saprospiraceae bacterium]|nr:hypothetical protein [Saprospiraceae bacterium]
MPTLFVHKLEAIQNKIKGKFISHWYNVITKHNDQMIEVLKQHIIKRLGNDLEHLDLVLSKFKQIETKRKEQLLSEGEVCKYVYFIAKGCLQVYVYDHEMNETTRDIVIEDHWCSELISFG